MQQDTAHREDKAAQARQPKPKQGHADQLEYRATIGARGPNMNDIPEAETDIRPEWRAEFDAATPRPLDLRPKYVFVPTPTPRPDDERYRSFETMQDYRDWCSQHLPRRLGNESE